MEEDQNSAEDEVTPQDPESTIVDEQTPEEASESESVRAEEDKQERNWRELRRKEQEAQQKLKMQQELIQNLLVQQQRGQAPTQQEVDEFAEIDPDDYPTWAQADKRIQKQAEAIAEKKFRELEAKREQERFVERLKARYPDFEDVVNSETIELLEQQEPELANTIASQKDPYNMGLQTYKIIKAMNIASDPATKRHAKEVEKNLKKNEKKIQSPQAYDKRPMAQAFSLSNMSKEEKNKLYEEMVGFANQTPGY